MSQAPARIVIAECIHEVCSFNPLPTRYIDFLVHRREKMFDYHRGIGSEMSGIGPRPLAGPRGEVSAAGRVLPRPVFTLPAGIAELAHANPTALYELLFTAASATLREVAANPKRLGASIAC